MVATVHSILVTWLITWPITWHTHTHAAIIIRSASVQVKEDNTYFLSVSRSDFKRILLSVESTNIKFEEHGKEVLLLEKARQGRYLVVKGRPDRMLDHLLESEIEVGSQEGKWTKMARIMLLKLVMYDIEWISIVYVHDIVCVLALFWDRIYVFSLSLCRHLCSGLLSDVPCIHVD